MQSQWCAWSTFNSQLSRPPICSVCQFLWCKYSQQGRFPAIKVMSLKTELGRDEHHWLWWHSASRGSTLGHFFSMKFLKANLSLFFFLGLLLLSRFSRVRLCDPIDGSLLGSSVPGILQARTLEWVTQTKSTQKHQLIFILPIWVIGLLKKLMYHRENIMKLVTSNVSVKHTHTYTHTKHHTTTP